MKKRKNIMCIIFASILTCSIIPNTHARVNFKKIIKTGGYTTLGVSAVAIGVVTAMICYVTGGISIFSKTTKVEQIRNASVMAIGPVLTAFYTAYRMFKNAIETFLSKTNKKNRKKRCAKKLDGIKNRKKIENKKQKIWSKS